MAVPTSQQPPTAAPNVCCQECQKPMQADFNPSLMPGRPGRWLLTCRTMGCGLRAVTLGPDQLPLTDAQVADYRERNAAREAFPNRR